MARARDGRRFEEEDQPDAMVVEHDPVNEQVLLGSGVALLGSEAGDALLSRFAPDDFLVADHHPIWAGLREMRRQKLAFDLATFSKVAPGANLDYLASLVGARPGVAANLDYHADCLQWDGQRARAAAGPVPSFLRSLADPSESPEKLRALAKSVQSSLDGELGAGRYLCSRQGLVADLVEDVRRRIAGTAYYPYGVGKIDRFEDGSRRIGPGTTPGQVTILTGISGSGKSALAAQVTLGVARQKRRVLYCAWEPQPIAVLELLACSSLGWSRSILLDGKDQRDREAMMPDEQLDELRAKARAIGKFVSVMRNPFRRTKGRRSNEAHLEVFREHVVASGADLVVVDLFGRLLVDASPEGEHEALLEAQAMAEETKAHFVLLAQQNKLVLQRPDKRPTIGDIKGSSAWFEIGDTVLGTHRPGQWKGVEDSTFQAIFLKQRYGKAPLVVEFDWDGDKGSISGGRSVEFEYSSESGIGDAMGEFVAPNSAGSGKKKRWGGG